MAENVDTSASIGQRLFSSDAGEDAKETDTPLSLVPTGGRPLCNVRLAGGIDLLGGSEEELQQFTDRLEMTADGYGMEISSNRSKFIVNSIKPRRFTNVWINGKTLEDVGQFKYLGSKQTKDGTSIKEVKARNTIEQEAHHKMGAR